MAKEWLSLQETADYLGVHPSTVRNWSNQGILPCYRTSGKHRRFLQSDLELWQQSRRSNNELEANTLIQAALKHTRLQISAGQLEQEGWYRKLDDDARDEFRKNSQNTMHGLMNFLVSSSEHTAQTGIRVIGEAYASLGIRQNLSRIETVQAFLFFRNALLESILNVYESASLQKPQAWKAVLMKINTFTDLVFLSLLEAYH